MHGLLLTQNFLGNKKLQISLLTHLILENLMKFANNVTSTPITLRQAFFYNNNKNKNKNKECSDNSQIS